MHSKVSSRIKYNEKGFSLVELIIVVAIMVALIAVIAPTYVKYVKNARDAVVDNAAEQVASFIKTEFASQVFSADKCKLKICKGDEGYLDLFIESGSFTYDGTTGDDALEKLFNACGIDKNRQVKSDRCYFIDINSTTDTISLNTKLDVVVEDGGLIE